MGNQIFFKIDFLHDLNKVSLYLQYVNEAKF